MRVHINLGVHDIDRSIAFYTRLFGTGPSKVRGDYANWRLDEPAMHLALVAEPGFEKPRTGEHFGIELMEDDVLDAWRKRATAAGVSVRTEEQVTCCYAVANKWWAADPDGNEWEFWVRSADAEAMHCDTSATDAMPMTTLAVEDPAPT